MATIIGLPKLSPTMEEGVLAKWIKKEGEAVSPGDIIAEVETDKANMDFTLEDEGTLLKFLVKEGDTVKLGAPVAILGKPGEDVAALMAQAASAAPAPAAAPAAPAPAAAAAAPAAKPAPAPAARPAPAKSANAPAPVAKPAPAAKAAPASAAAGRILASPIAKTLATEHGIDLRQLKGTGPGGRIVERDVQARLTDGAPAEAEAPEPEAEAPEAEAPEAEPEEAARAPAARAPARPAAPPPSEAEGEEYTDKSLSLMRKTIARRLLEAKQTIPHFYVTGEIDAAKLLAFRADLNAILGDENKVSLNDVIIKATAAALVRLPAANASFLGDRIRTHGRVHIGVAVSVEDGLITPVIRDADQKGIRAISVEIKELAARARIRKLLPEEMTGGTFTVSNLGMFGVDLFQAIINPPEAGILAVGAVRKVPVVDGDRLVVGERLTLSLSCDHRVIDGALGARLFAELKKILEHPAILAA